MTLQKIALVSASLATLCLPAAALAATKPASGGAAGGDPDARCLAVSMVMVGSQDTGARNMGAQGISYYLGRLDARPNKTDLETRLSAQFAGFNQQTVQAAAKECMQAMNTRGVAFHAVTEALQKKYGHAAPAAGAPAAQAPAAPAPAH
jgi:hypothetical protein